MTPPVLTKGISQGSELICGDQHRLCWSGDVPILEELFDKHLVNVFQFASFSLHIISIMISHLRSGCKLKLT